MTTLTLIPNVEKLLRAFLIDQPEITELVDTRVYTELPRRVEAKFPLVRFHRYGGAPLFAWPLRWDTADVQVDCYGGPKDQAELLADTARAVIAERLVGTHDLGSVARVTFGGKQDLPDEDFTPPQPRFLFDVSITYRPNP